MTAVLHVVSRDQPIQLLTHLRGPRTATHTVFDIHPGLAHARHNASGGMTP